MFSKVGFQNIFFLKLTCHKCDKFSYKLNTLIFSFIILPFFPAFLLNFSIYPQAVWAWVPQGIATRHWVSAFFHIIPILICYHFPPFLNILFHFFLYSCIPVFIYIIFFCIFLCIFFIIFLISLCISWTGFVFSSTSIPSVSLEYSCYVPCWVKLFVFQNYFSQYSQLFHLKLTYFLKVS